MGVFPYAVAPMAAVPFDRSVLKVGQVILITGLATAWALDLLSPFAAVVLPLLALMMLGGAAGPRTSLPRLLYVHWLRPAGLVRPRVHREDPAPHRFAQLVGGIFLVAASLAALFSALLVAWTLAWIVVALALLNFTLDICVGCIVYAQLVRMGALPRRSRSTATG